MSTISIRAGLTALLLAAVASPAVRADFEQAMNHYKAGKYLEAASEFQALVDESPEYADGYFMLGICFMKSAKPGDAEKNFKKAIELKPDNFLYHFNLANVYQSQGKFDTVVKTLDEAEGLLEKKYALNFYKLRGFAHASRKRWSDAIVDLEKAAEIEPDPATLTQIGKGYFGLGEYDKATEYLRQALRMSGDDADSHQLLSEALLNMAAKATSDAQKKSRYSEALSEARAFLKLKPASVDASYLVGRAALGAGEYDRAIESFDKVLKTKPDHCNAMANMGKAFSAKEDWANALAALDNATTCDSGMAVAWENKGFVYQKQASAQRSENLYNKAIQAYRQAMAGKGSAAIEKQIEVCQQNIEVLNHNMEAQRLEAEQAEAARKAKEEYEEAQRKQQEWQKRNGGDGGGN